MYLAIGDVVRDRTDMELGTVIGRVPGGCVALPMSGGAARLIAPYDLALVARRKPSTSTVSGVVDPVVLLVGLLAAYISGNSVQVLGGSWLLMFFASTGAFSFVVALYGWIIRLAGPRRFRV
ncbi:hypothetical protein ACIO3O_28550 [Streptomyces sp. NPDC087440]|uniref:hypothetical protein n=1 Tax=Streptomyces sp. NPDC087440 TaxID=3365790 RepID=UPI003817CA4F